MCGNSHQRTERASRARTPCTGRTVHSNLWLTYCLLFSPLSPHQSPLALHLLKDSSSSEALLCVQKLIHCNPTNVWVLAALVYYLEQSSMPELKSRHNLVLQHQSKPISWLGRLHDSPLTGTKRFSTLLSKLETMHVQFDGPTLLP